MKAIKTLTLVILMACINFASIATTTANSIEKQNIAKEYNLDKPVKWKRVAA